MLRSRYALILFLPMLLLLMAFHQAPLINPAPIPVPANVSPEQIVKAIKAALLHHDWAVTGEKPGEIAGSLHLREHTASIAISYDARNITLRYVDSTNLKYEKKNGGEYIHRNYMDWADAVAADIKSNLILFGK